MNTLKPFRDKLASDRIRAAQEEYEASIVNLFMQAYREAVGSWPNDRLEQALYEAVRFNVTR
jgi:hypothetical protein